MVAEEHGTGPPTPGDPNRIGDSDLNTEHRHPHRLFGSAFGPSDSSDTITVTSTGEGGTDE